MSVPKIEKRAAASAPWKRMLNFLVFGIGYRLFVHDNNFQGLKWGLSNSYNVIEDILKTYVVPKPLVIFRARALLTYSSGLFSLKGLGLRKQGTYEKSTKITAFPSKPRRQQLLLAGSVANEWKVSFNIFQPMKKQTRFIWCRVKFRCCLNNRAVVRITATLEKEKQWNDSANKTPINIHK